jgi:hypothetical protein
MGGVDYLTCPAPDLFIGDCAALPRVRIRRKTLSDFPFAEFETVAEHEAECFCRRAARVTGEFLKPALLSGT